MQRLTFSSTLPKSDTIILVGLWQVFSWKPALWLVQSPINMKTKIAMHVPRTNISIWHITYKQSLLSHIEKHLTFFRELDKYSSKSIQIINAIFIGVEQILSHDINHGPDCHDTVDNDNLGQSWTLTRSPFHTIQQWPTRIIDRFVKLLTWVVKIPGTIKTDPLLTRSLSAAVAGCRPLHILGWRAVRFF